MSTSRDTLTFYWEQVRRHKTTFFIMLICIPLASLCISALLSYFFSQALGNLLGGDESVVFQYLLFATIAGIIGFTLNFIGFSAMTKHEAHIITDLRNTTFERLIKKDLRFFIDQKVGALTSKYIDFVRSYMVLQDLLIIRTIGLVLSLSVGLTLIAVQSWILALILVGLLIGLVIEVKLSLRYRQPSRIERRNLRSDIHGKVADNLTNSLIVKTFGGEDREIKDLQTMGDRFTKVYIKDIGFVHKEGSFRVLILVATMLTTITVSSWMVVNGQLNAATAIFALTYLQLVGSQLFMIGELLNGYEEALLEASPMSYLLSLETEVNDAPDAKPLTISQPKIEFKNISYHYGDSGENVINNVSLKIPAGQKVGLVGHSGAGKSTLTHLLLRFSDVTQGAILFDDQDIRDVTQQSLRQQVAYVPQEPLLFHRSLRENIAYGNPDATDTQVRQAASHANALEFIETLPHGFETLVGERGVKLSGGQRQRIAIARALLKDAPILLLDEATSALDSESESLIQEALEELMKARTSIVIAHRLSTIAKLDRIIVMDDGRIAEDGTHAELIAKKGIYAKLWNHQSGGFIEE